MSIELQDLTVEQLRALAGERGVTVPERAKKAEIIAAIEAAPAPADAGDQAAPDQPAEGDTPADTSDGADALVESETDREDGLVEIRRPIEHVNARGDWTCPFSGLRVMAGSEICPQSGAHRYGDEAYIVTTPDEES